MVERKLKVKATEEDEIIDLDSLSLPPRLLRTLYLEGCLQRLPHWIPSLHNLVRVCLRWSKLRDIDPLQSFQGLPNLLELELDQAYEGEGLCFQSGGFQRLKRLSIYRLKGLRWVSVEAGSMPHLEELYIGNCKLVDKLPFGIEHLTSLKYLHFVYMSDGLITNLYRNLQDHNIIFDLLTLISGSCNLTKFRITNGCKEHFGSWIQVFQGSTKERNN
ncbi:hypothetical protein ACSBR2_040622 [Camellia fascicularis]